MERTRMCTFSGGQRNMERWRNKHTNKQTNDEENQQKMIQTIAFQTKVLKKTVQNKPWTTDRLKHELKQLKQQCVCVRERVCVCERERERERERECVCVCVRVFVTNEDIHLHNDTGMTGITRWRWFMRTLTHVPTFQNTYKSYRVSFWGKVEIHTVSCEG